MIVSIDSGSISCYLKTSSRWHLSTSVAICDSIVVETYNYVRFFSFSSVSYNAQRIILTG